MAIKGSVLEVFTQTKRTDICFACAFDDMFSGFNTARKAAWLKLTPLEYASDRKDSQMLLHSIRESKTSYSILATKIQFECLIIRCL